jgi:hypothetical protein
MPEAAIECWRLKPWLRALAGRHKVRLRGLGCGDVRCLQAQIIRKR